MIAKRSNHHGLVQNAIIWAAFFIKMKPKFEKLIELCDAEFENVNDIIASLETFDPELKKTLSYFIKLDYTHYEQLLSDRLDSPFGFINKAIDKKLALLDKKRFITLELCEVRLKLDSLLFLLNKPTEQPNLKIEISKILTELIESKFLIRVISLK